MTSVWSIIPGNVFAQGHRRSNWRSNNSVFLVGNSGRREFSLRAVSRGGGKDEGGDEERDRADERAQATIEKSKKVLEMQNNLLDRADERAQATIEKSKKVLEMQNNLLDRADERAQATIEKSKKVLEMQNNLLEKIAKRRNLVNSISTEVPSEQLQVSDSEMDSNSIAEIDKPSSIGLPLESSLQKIPYESTSVHEKQTPITESKPVETTTAPSKTIPNEEKKQEIVPKRIKIPKLEPSFNQNVTLYAPVVKSENKIQVKEPVIVSSENRTTNSEEEKKVPGPLAGDNVMNVILVAAECAPWSKTGGLGDVVGALPKALARRGHRVMVVVPRYGNYAEAHDLGIRKYYKVDGQDLEVNYYHAYIDGVDFVFIDCPFFRHRDNDVYGGQRMDILKRMVLLCKVAVEVPWHVPCGGVCYGDGNLAFIANDWHTALLPVYLKAYYRDNGLMQYARSILVIHNIAHQGRGPVNEFKCADLPEHYLDLFKLYDPVGGEHMNIFAGGIKAADRVVAVSHGYAWEIKTAEGGWGLHEIISNNHWKLSGIVNGIDPMEWNPKVDVHLKSDGYTNYSLETLDKGKAQCKEALQRELGLDVRGDVPIIAFIGRLDGQKGIDLIADAIPWIVSQDVQLIMLGTGRQDLENLLRKLEGEHRDKVRAWVGFNVPMAHRITAGADVIMMPSRYEPCGLNQLYAMVYGTIPVVHAVGGLRDTVVPFDPFENLGFGWTFDRVEVNKLIDALLHCLNTYRNYKESWRGLQVRGMMQDLSWDVVAEKYEEVLVAAKYQW